jgi:hypothetical protein
LQPHFPFLPAETNKSAQLQQQLDQSEAAHVTEINTYKGLLCQARVRYQEQTSDYKQATKKIAALSVELRELAVLREVEHERAQSFVMHLLEEAMERVKGEADDMWQEKLDQEKKNAVQKLAQHKQQTKEVEKKLVQANGDLHRLEAGVASMYESGFPWGEGRACHHQGAWHFRRAREVCRGILAQ